MFGAKVRAAMAVIVFFSISSGQAQDSTLARGGFHPDQVGPVRKIVATTIEGGILVGSLVRSYYDWWNVSRIPFYFVHEGWFNDYSNGIDKVGHIYTSYFYFHTLRNVMLWGGYSPSTAFWWAAGGVAFFAVSVELGDGLTHGFGFAPEDLASNMLGLGYAALQTQVPFLKNFNLKWSYVPPDGYRWPPRFTDHYDGHTYWLTFNVHNLLPSSVSDYWPEFLQLAVGYGVSDHWTARRGVIGLDFNLSALRPLDDTALLLVKTVDMFHLPAPGIEFTQHKEPEYLLFQLH